MIPIYEPRIKKKYKEAIIDQLDTGWIGPGKKVEEFEQRISEFCGMNYCVAFNSGTSALLASILVGETEYAKERADRAVLVPSYGYVAAANAASSLGFEIVPVEVNEGGFMDSVSLENKISILSANGVQISSVVFIEHNGIRSEEYAECYEVCDYYDIKFISDSCVSFGRDDFGADFVTFSFSVPKILTTGQGGACLTNNYEYYLELKNISDQGGNWRQDRNHKNIGLNLRMTDLNASLGIAQLDDWEDIRITRKQIWEYYDKYFKKGLTEDDGTRSDDQHWCCTLRINSKEIREELIKELDKENIGNSSFYRAIYNNEAYNVLGKDFRCENAERLERELIYLPSSLTLKKKEIKRICKTINSVLEKYQ